MENSEAVSMDELLKKLFFLTMFPNPLKGKTEEEIFEGFFDQREIQDYFKKPSFPPCKSKLTSESARNEGNALFRRKAILEALKHYNWSVKTAPHPKLDSRKRESEMTQKSGEVTNMNNDEASAINIEEHSIQGSTCDADKGKEMKRDVSEEAAPKETSDVSDDQGGNLQKEVEVLRKEVSLLRDEVTTLQGKVALCCKELSKMNQTDGENRYASSVKESQVTPKTVLDPEDEKDTLEYQELALAYANRSAVLFDLKQYEECLRDIEMALEHGYPKRLKEKLLKRRDKCLRALEEGESQEKLVFDKCSCDEVTFHNKHIVGASDAVNISFSSGKGRHLVASKNIHPGEVLIDHPVMVTPKYPPNLLIRFCYTCNSSSVAPLPCPGCAVVSYCSKGCRDKGVEKHERECFDTNPKDIVLEIWHLYRLMMQKTFTTLKEEVLRLRREAESQAPERRGFNEDGVYDPSEYRALYHLETHLEQETDNLQMECVSALTLLSLLLRSQRFFIDEAGQAFVPKREDLVFLGGVALRHFMAFRINGKGAVTSTSNVREFAVSPLVAMLNHSCYPSAMLACCGDRIIITALRSINPGEEVTLAYRGFTFNRVPQARRQSELLQQYSFLCRCNACKGNWTEILDIGVRTFKCPSCGGPVSSSLKECMTCELDFLKGDGEIEYNLGETDRLIRQAQHNFLRISLTLEDPSLLQENIRALSSIIETFDKYIYPPDEVHIKAQETLSMCLERKAKERFLHGAAVPEKDHFAFERLPFENLPFCPPF